MHTPAVYVGTQPGYRHLPPVELYNLLINVGSHPAGSTVSRETLETHGYAPPPFSPEKSNRADKPERPD